MISDSAYNEFYKISEEIRKNILKKLDLIGDFPAFSYVREIILCVREIDLLQIVESFIESSAGSKNMNTQNKINTESFITDLKQLESFSPIRLKQILSRLSMLDQILQREHEIWFNLYKRMDLNLLDRDLIDLFSACMCIVYRFENPFYHILAKISVIRDKPLHASEFNRLAIQNSSKMHGSFLEEENKLFIKLLKQGSDYKDHKRLNSIRTSFEKCNISPPDGISKAIIQTRKLIEAAAVASENKTVVFHGERGTGKSHLARYFHSIEKPDKEFLEIPLKRFSTLKSLTDFLCGSRNIYSGNYNRGVLDLNSDGTILFQNTESLDFASMEFLRKLILNRTFKKGFLNNEMKFFSTRIILGFDLPRNCNFLKKLPVKDFFKKIDNVYIPLHSLNERPEDIIYLADSFLSDLAKKESSEKKVLSKKVKSRLKEFNWAKGIGQLKYVITASAMLSSGKTINQSFLPERVLNNFR